MSQGTGSGYKGFRTWAERECPTLKPGETYDTRDNKFSHMSLSNNQKSIAVGGNNYRTVTHNSFGEVKAKDYKVPDKRGVLALEEERDSNALPREFVASTIYQNDYPDFHKNLSRMSEVSLEKYQQSFYEVAFCNEDKKIIDIYQVKRVLQNALGSTPADHELMLTQKILERKNDGILDWELFQSGICEASEILKKESESSCCHSKSVSSPTNTPSKVLKGAISSSSHQIDYGMYGQKPTDRPYMRKTGMASTTNDLNSGTPKETSQIPGYCGFIPISNNNPEAIQHGTGQIQRSPIGDLRLYHKDNLPGYTGHHPQNSKNYHGELKTGQDPKTTNGAFFTNLMS